MNDIRQLFEGAISSLLSRRDAQRAAAVVDEVNLTGFTLEVFSFFQQFFFF